MTKLKKEIFRTYDIRGIYPIEIDSNAAYAVARATVRFLGAKNVVVGRDMRIGSPEMAKAAIKGVVDEGANVHDIGEVGIELTYFACGFHKMDGGLMITASHNPKEYNGIKLIREKAVSLTSGTGLEKVKKLSLNTNWEKEEPKRKKGKIYTKKVLRDYVSFIRKIIDPRKFKPLKIVVDAENGMAGVILEKVLQESPIKLIKINFKPSGKFPKHDPNPLLPEHRKETIAAIKKEKADVGFITDGDGDRVTVFDEKGEFIVPCFAGPLVAETVLKRTNKKLPVCWELRNFWSMQNVAKKYGVELYYTKVGFPFVKLKMREKKAVFGGENSSHFFFRDFFTSDSGVLAILNVLDLLSKKERPLSELVKKFREKYFVIEEKNFETESAEKIFLELEKFYKRRRAKISHLDGVSIDFKDWHCNLRASNTEPVIRLNLEAKSKSLLKEKGEELRTLINKYK